MFSRMVLTSMLPWKTPGCISQESPSTECDSWYDLTKPNTKSPFTVPMPPLSWILLTMVSSSKFHWIHCWSSDRSGYQPRSASMREFCALMLREETAMALPARTGAVLLPTRGSVGITSAALSSTWMSLPLGIRWLAVTSGTFFSSPAFLRNFVLMLITFLPAYLAGHGGAPTMQTS